MSIITRTCSLEKCDKILFCKGFCRPHYRAFTTYGDPFGYSTVKRGMKAKPPTPCIVKPCEELAKCRQMCWRHYMRNRVHGNPRAMVRGKERHGQSKIMTGAYRSWRHMKDRCDNPRSTGYKNYGGRGVKVCTALAKFRTFYLLLGDRPIGETLDRKNPDGHYSCGSCNDCIANCWLTNVQWATGETQAHNKRVRNKLGFKGVEKDKRVFTATIKKDGVRYRLGRFKTPEEAAEAYRKKSMELYGN